jgi:hypothetical protein
MLQDSVVQRHELFAASGAIAAHATHGLKGFRQRDLKFYVELFINWASSSAPQNAPQFQNVQIARYLSWLLKDGLASKISRKGPPAYRLTRIGLLELLNRLVHQRRFPEREHFFFLLYFLRSFKPRLAELVRQEGKLFPASLRIELDALLDTKELLETELSQAKRDLQRVEERIESGKASNYFVQEAFKAGKTLKEVTLQVQKLYPYDLNSERPLSELLTLIEPVYLKEELEGGALAKIELVWEPEREQLKSYINSLLRLREKPE